MATSFSARAGILTRAGRGRQVNEDWCGTLEARSADELERDGLLWVVADGVGAYGTGQEASQTAGEAVLRAYRQATEADPAARLRQAVEAGNRAVRERRRTYVRQGRDRPVMTTMLALLLAGGRAVLAHVGDCRAYLVRDGRIRQLTRDHTQVAEQVASGAISAEQARTHPQRHVISRALGQRDTVVVDLTEPSLGSGDRLVLCSDGLPRYLEDDEIRQLAGVGLPEAAARAMIDRAEARGGEDDITVAVVEVTASAASADPTPTPRQPAGRGAAGRDHLATLHAIGQRISASLDLTETLRSIMDSVVEVTRAERGFVMLWDAAAGGLTYSIGHNVAPTGHETREFSRTIVQSVFDTGRPVRLGDAMADPRLNRHDSIVVRSLRSVLCTPLEVQGNRIGVVYVENRHDAEVFTDADLELLCAFASQAAIALEHARLHDELKAQVAANVVMRANHENVLRSINSAIISVDADGQVLTFNRVAEEIFGIHAEEARRRPLSEVLPSSLRRTVDALVTGHDESDTGPSQVQLDVRLGHRGRAVLSVKVLPLADAADRRIGSVLVIDDLTRNVLVDEARQREEAEKERIKALFGRFLAPSVVDVLMADPRSIQLGGTRREVTVLFADIRGFTGIAERHSPEEVVSMLNSYLACATEVILGAGGTLDKFLGDGVMAFFNAPLPQEDHVLAAVRAAMAMQTCLSERQAAGSDPVGFGVGINTGECIVGNIGTAELMNYTIIGDAVNVAARLQGEARRGEVLLSGTSYDRIAESVEVEGLGSIHVKGRAQPVPLYKVLHVLG